MRSGTGRRPEPQPAHGPATGMTTRIAYLAACASLIALIFLGIAWELRLAPIQPGGSALVFKVLPLLAALFGILHGKRYTYKWSSLLILLYFAEGLVRVRTGTWANGWPSVKLPSQRYFSRQPSFSCAEPAPNEKAAADAAATSPLHGGRRFRRPPAPSPCHRSNAACSAHSGRPSPKR